MIPLYNHVQYPLHNNYNNILAEKIDPCPYKLYDFCFYTIIVEMELFFPKGKSAKPAGTMQIVKPNLFKSKLNKARNSIKKQKNYMNELYNDVTSSMLRPTDETYKKAAFFNNVRDGYEFMAGPYKRQGFPSNTQIQERLNYIKTAPGRARLAKLEADVQIKPENIVRSVAMRMSRIGKKQLLNKIRKLESEEMDNIAAEFRAMPIGGAGFEAMPTGGDAGVSPGISPSASTSLSRSNSGNSTYSTENMVVIGSNPDAKGGGRRNCTYKKSQRRRRRKTHRKRRN